jgi:hypothetical protein
MTTLLILFLSAASIAIFVALVTLPWWFARSMHRHRIWRLRDTLVDDMICGRLPSDHKAVRQILDRVEGALDHGHRLTMLDLVVWMVANRGTDPSTRRYMEQAVADCPLAGLDSEQAKCVHIGYVLYSDWSNIC